MYWDSEGSFVHVCDRPLADTGFPGGGEVLNKF